MLGLGRSSLCKLNGIGRERPIPTRGAVVGKIRKLKCVAIAAQGVVHLETSNGHQPGASKQGRLPQSATVGCGPQTAFHPVAVIVNLQFGYFRIQGQSIRKNYPIVQNGISIENACIRS